MTAMLPTTPPMPTTDAHHRFQTSGHRSIVGSEGQDHGGEDRPAKGVGQIANTVERFLTHVSSSRVPRLTGSGLGNLNKHQRKGSNPKGKHIDEENAIHARPDEYNPGEERGHNGGNGIGEGPHPIGAGRVPGRNHHSDGRVRGR